jgi:dimethylargininase
VKASAVRGVRHLQSACTALHDETLLAHPPAVDLARTPAGVRVLAVPADEPQGANAARVGDTLLVPASAPRTAELLARAGYRFRAVDVGELAKAEGAVTCGSLIFDA